MNIALTAGLAALALSGLTLSSLARAEIIDQSPAGFEVRHVVVVAAPPATVYAAILQPAHWWNSAHSFSGDAKNLSMDLAAACFCEKLPAGFVRHLSIIYADGKTLRLEGAMGPMQTTGATGHLIFAPRPKDAGTELTVTYDAGGYAKGGLAEGWAKPLDMVVGEQTARLKAYVETGKAP